MRPTILTLGLRSVRLRTSGLALAATLLAAGCDPDAEQACTPDAGLACVFMGTGIAGLGLDGLDSRKTELYLPQDVTEGIDGTIYVVDWNNHRIRADHDGVAVTLVGTGYLGDAPAGTADQVSLNHPTHLTPLPDGDLMIAAWHNSKILRYDPSTNTVEPICGTGGRSFAGDEGPAIEAVLDLPVATGLGPDGSLYISDQANQRIRRIDPQGIIDTFAGVGAAGFSGDDGPALEAQIQLPGGQSAPPAGRLDVDASGNVFLADSGNHRIRKIDTDGMMTTVAGDGTPAARGDGGPATAASLFRPSDVEVGPDGSLYIADTDNSCVRKVDPAGVITTVVGICGSPGLGDEGVLGSEIQIDRPYGVELGEDGTLYVADTHNHRILAVYPE